MQIATVVGILLIVVGLARFAFGGITHYWRVRACAGNGALWTNCLDQSQRSTRCRTTSEAPQRWMYHSG
jgi:hypothetical protein